jgi:Tlde1 domain
MTSRVALAGGNRKAISRKAISLRPFSGGAVACLLVGCAWTVYSNILAANVYPTLDSAGYDEPVARPPVRLAMRSAAQAINDAFAALPKQAPVIAKPATVAAITPEMFNERFAASEPQGVPSRAAEAAPPPRAPKLAEAPKPKQAAPAQVALNVAAPASRPTETKPTKMGDSIRDMAQRAKSAVMSIASSEKVSITEKLWGKQPSRSLLSFASADTNLTGSIGDNQNGGRYDRDTAVYDIAAHTVYLPDGSKLEAHSGLGSELDDPRSASVRMRGVTPPHMYELKPREALFHGVPALRLNPVGGEDAIYGRSGLLAHTYMLGPNGDSNGCVSFKDYNAFLNAYRNQGIKKLAVVARID